MSTQEADPIMLKLRELEHQAGESAQWVHYKGWNDLKTTFNDALAICEEIRSNAAKCPHSETKELPSFAKGYINEKIGRILTAMGVGR
jgi:hypothetical protein